MKEGKEGLLTTLEKKLGIPPLAQLADSLHKFPDAKQLELIKEVLLIVERLSKTTATKDLEQVVDLTREINSIPLERLEHLDKLLRRIEGIISKTPEELTNFLKSLKE